MQYFRLLFLFASFLFWFVSQIILQQAQTEMTNRNAKNVVLSDIYKLILCHKEYLRWQNYTQRDDLKNVLRTIKAAANIGRCVIKLNKKTDKNACFFIVIQSKNEQDLYKFLYLVENYIPGIVSILDLRIEKRNSDKSDMQWLCSMNIDIANSIGNIFCKSENNVEPKLSSCVEDICRFSIFSSKKVMKHKLYGIILPFAFIDDLKLQKKDSIDDYSIEEVYQDRIILKNRKNVLKDIALGEAF